MNISSSVHLKESCFKLTVWIYQQVFISRKVVLSCGMCCHEVFISSKVVLKLQYAYIIKCSSQGKLFKVAVCVFIMECSSQRTLF